MTKSNKKKNLKNVLFNLSFILKKLDLPLDKIIVIQLSLRVIKNLFKDNKKQTN